MQNRIRVNKKSLIRWKVYFDRSRIYVGYLQTFLIAVVFVRGFSDEPWAAWVFKYAVISIPVILVFFIASSLLLGYLDSKFGFREEEQRNLSRSNPVMMEILESVKNLKKEIAELKDHRV